jgi:hypothetical protein
MPTRTPPIIDLSRFRDPAADREEFLGDLRRAAHEVGGFLAAVPGWIPTSSGPTG